MKLFQLATSNFNFNVSILWSSFRQNSHKKTFMHSPKLANFRFKPSQWISLLTVSPLCPTFLFHSCRPLSSWKKQIPWSICVNICACFVHSDIMDICFETVFAEDLTQLGSIYADIYGGECGHLSPSNSAIDMPKAQ